MANAKVTSNFNANFFRNWSIIFLIVFSGDEQTALENKHEGQELLSSLYNELVSTLENIVRVEQSQASKSERTKRDVFDEEHELDAELDRASRNLTSLRDRLYNGASKIKAHAVFHFDKLLGGVSNVLDRIRNRTLPTIREGVANVGDEVDQHVRANKVRAKKLLDYLEEKYFKVRRFSERLTDEVFDIKKNVVGHVKEHIRDFRENLRRED